MMVTDPVCGMEIERDQAAGEQDFDGQTYYFCSEECEQEFQENPRRYAMPFAI